MLFRRANELGIILKGATKEFTISEFYTIQKTVNKIVLCCSGDIFTEVLASILIFMCNVMNFQFCLGMFIVFWY